MKYKRDVTVRKRAKLLVVLLMPFMLSACDVPTIITEFVLKRPDLVIQLFSYFARSGDGEVNHGEDVDFDVTAENIPENSSGPEENVATQAAPNSEVVVVVKEKEDDGGFSEIDRESVKLQGLEPDERATIQFTYRFPRPGTYKLTAIVDGTNKVKERDENNNERLLSLNGLGKASKLNESGILIVK